MANLNVDKRIFELPPFMHRVYCFQNVLYFKSEITHFLEFCGSKPEFEAEIHYS